MVYVIQKTTGSTEDIDKMQEKFRQQIYQGCLVLPPNYSLVKVVEQMSDNDYTKLIEKVIPAEVAEKAEAEMARIVTDTAPLPLNGKDRRKFFAGLDKHKEVT